AHQLVNIYGLKRLGDETILERRTVPDEHRPHRNKLIVVAVATADLIEIAVLFGGGISLAGGQDGSFSGNDDNRGDAVVLSEFKTGRKLATAVNICVIGKVLFQGV